MAVYHRTLRVTISIIFVVEQIATFERLTAQAHKTQTNGRYFRSIAAQGTSREICRHLDGKRYFKLCCGIILRLVLRFGNYGQYYLEGKDGQLPGLLKACNQTDLGIYPGQGYRSATPSWKGRPERREMVEFLAQLYGCFSRPHGSTRFCPEVRWGGVGEAVCVRG